MNETLVKILAKDSLDNDEVGLLSNWITRMDESFELSRQNQTLVNSLFRNVGSISQIDQLSNNLGVMRSGEFLALSAGIFPTDTDAVGTFMSANGETFGANVYHIGGVNLGVLQWGANSSTGKFYVGAGSIILDADGIYVTGAASPTDVNKIRFGYAAAYSTPASIYAKSDGLHIYGGANLAITDYSILINGTVYIYAGGGMADALVLDQPLKVAYGGTGGATAAVAASNLGLGTEDSPTFTGVTSGILIIPAAGDLTITSGVVTVTGSRHTLIPETTAPDNLDTVNGLTTSGTILIFSLASSTYAITLKDGTGNLRLAGDCVLSNVNDQIVLIRRVSTAWDELSRSINGA